MEDRILDLKTQYRHYKEMMPETARLMEPRRYTTEGKAAVDFPAIGLAVMSDITGIVGCLETFADHPRQSTAYEDAYRWLSSLRHLSDHEVPTFYLHADIGEALLDTELPESTLLEEVKWAYPCMRIFLPRGWYFYRGENLAFFDVHRIPGGALPEPHSVMIGEGISVIQAMGGVYGLPGYNATSDATTLYIACVANYTDPDKSKRDVLLSPWDRSTLKDFFSDATLSMGQDPERESLLRLVINLVMLLGYAPDEVSEEVLLRKAKTNGRGEIVREALWSPRYIGRPTFGKIKPSSPGATGTGTPQYGKPRRGHWKRQAHGPSHSLRKVIWVNLYRTRSREERGLPPEG